MFRNRSLLLLLCLGIALSSCISNKKIVYVKDYTAKDPTDFLADTIFDAPADDYKLASGDIIYIKSDHPTLANSFQQLDVNYLSDSRTIQAVPALAGFLVDSAGYVTMPIVGKIAVEGLTIFDARNKIEKAAEAYFINPAIRVFLMNYFVTVLGEVNRPGRYQVYNHRVNIFEAMGLAGDATDLADRQHVKVIRNRDGKNHLYSVDLTDQTILAKEEFYLKPNDIIIIKPLKRKKFATRDVQNVFNAISAAISVVTLYLLIKDN